MTATSPSWAQERCFSRCTAYAAEATKVSLLSTVALLGIQVTNLNVSASRSGWHIQTTYKLCLCLGHLASIQLCCEVVAATCYLAKPSGLHELIWVLIIILEDLYEVSHDRKFGKTLGGYSKLHSS